MGVHCSFWKGDRGRQDIKGIARKVASEEFPHLASGDERLDSVIDRLRRKFTKDKDLYITRAAEQYNFQRMDMLRAVRRLLIRLQDLGVPVDLSPPNPPKRRDPAGV